MDCSTAQRSLDLFGYGLYVVTSHDTQGRLNGQISNAIMQVTAGPPHIALAMNHKELTHDFIVKSGALGITVIDESAPLKFIGLFGFKSGRETDKLSQVAYTTGITGSPLVTDHAAAIIEAKIINTIDAGTHALFIADVVNAQIVGTGIPMSYKYYHEVIRGKTPPNAPTYRPVCPPEQETKPRRTDMKKYLCDVCGWEYDPEKGDPEGGIQPGTAFEDIPDDWVCPVCGAGKEDFSVIG